MRLACSYEAPWTSCSRRSAALCARRSSSIRSLTAPSARLLDSGSMQRGYRTSGKVQRPAPAPHGASSVGDARAIEREFPALARRGCDVQAGRRIGPDPFARLLQLFPKALGVLAKHDIDIGVEH